MNRLVVLIVAAIAVVLCASMASACPVATSAVVLQGQPAYQQSSSCGFQQSSVVVAQAQPVYYQQATVAVAAAPVVVVKQVVKVQRVRFFGRHH